MFPQLLKPNNTEIFDIDSEQIKVPKCSIKFDSWDGEPIQESFGGKPIVKMGGRPMFAEMAITKLFLSSGWDSRWVETYGGRQNDPFFFSDWKDDKYKNQKNDPITNEKVLETLRNISENNKDSFSGCWDVLGWSGDEIIFAESKRLKRDSVRSTQLNWLKAGLNSGLETSNFMIVEWDFSE